MSGTQENWRWCIKCQGMYFAGNNTAGACPAGGAHENVGSGNYILYQNWNVGGQPGWRWCHKCQGLWFGGGNSRGVCPLDHVGHDSGGSGNYILGNNYDQNTWPNKVASNVQDGWRWCNKCQGLFFAGNPTPGACPAGGGHNSQGSGDYFMNQNPFVGIPPKITVTHPGSFHVTGDGFKPSSTVTVRVVDDQLTTRNYQQSATFAGHLDMTVSLQCNPGAALHFSATDGTANPGDITGLLWSNTFTLPC